jgi:hypothetical protein
LSHCSEDNGEGGPDVSSNGIARSLIFFKFGSDNVMRRVRERHLVRPPHDHDEEQQQHLLPHSSSTIPTLLVAPNAHSLTSLRLKILRFQDFERLKILGFHIFFLFPGEVFRVLYM